MSQGSPRRGYVDGPYGQVHYRRLGEGAPLILLHQAGMDGRQFDAVHPLLASLGFDVVAFDLPGFGGSDVPPFVPRVEDLAAGLIPAIHALGFQAARIVGHHTGAMVGTEIALSGEIAVERLILNGPMPLTQEEREAFFAEKLPREKTWVPQPGAAHIAAFAAVRERLVGGTLPTERVNSFVLQAMGGQAPFWYGHNAGFGYRHEDSLLRIECPTMILTNTGDQIYAHALRAHALRPDMAFAALEGGGVDIVEQQPDAWVEAVVAFLR
ncbi:alpha/beta hydrolase [Sphingobium sp. H39-3-25]|uniref:alpha/beta fold hydrolase n=1 Tax=Sphingobium arseniciresistens TaxID=3030834 RepID=UPI0023B9A654|nr:alpha/beta hydrolase [Sphingobium arseniciresistens]